LTPRNPLRRTTPAWCTGLAISAISALTHAAPASAARPAAAPSPPAAAATASSPPPDWRPDISAARRYAVSRPGVVAFAVRTEARFWGFREDRVYPSASVLKAMLLAAYLRHARSRPLRRDERALLAPMIRRSDNAAATRIRDRLGNAALVRLARAAHMTAFAPAAVWGLSRITARDQTRFFLRIDALLPPRHRAYGLRLLRDIVPSQRWGIGRITLPGWHVYFKGGWGSGSGAVDHQVALLTHGDIRLSVAVLTAANGSHAAGKATLEGVFRRLLRHLSTTGR
jgi:beta-lactamase class A